MTTKNDPVNNGKPWTDSDLEYIVDQAGNLSWRQIAKNLGRTYGATRHVASKAGITAGTYTPWTPEEEAILRREAPNVKNWVDMMGHLPDRSYRAIKNKARELGLRRVKPWTPPEFKRLLKMRERGLTWRVVGERLGRTPTSCSDYYRRSK